MDFTNLYKKELIVKSGKKSPQFAFLHLSKHTDPRVYEIEHCVVNILEHCEHGIVGKHVAIKINEDVDRIAFNKDKVMEIV